MPYKIPGEKELKWRREHVSPSFQHIPDEIVDWGRAFIKEKILDPCVDNFRMARVWKSSDCRRYQRQKKKGCCGFYDELVIGPDGNKYLIGCNYGH
jgi:hypothetical protein